MGACFAVCINEGGYIDDLKVRTIYRVLPDESTAKSNYLRIIDETGEDYLYSASYFVLIDVPQEVEQAFSPHVYSSGGEEGIRKAKV